MKLNEKKPETRKPKRLFIRKNDLSKKSRNKKFNHHYIFEINLDHHRYHHLIVN